MPLRGVLYGLALSGVVAVGQIAVTQHPAPIKTNGASANVASAYSLPNSRVGTADRFGPSPQPKNWGMVLIALFAIGVASRADVRRLGRVTV